MKRTIEIEDTLEERVANAIESVQDELKSYVEQNPDKEELPCLNNDLDYSGTIHEIVDGAVPIYTYEIETTWFLHARELESAYENAGLGDNPRENNGMSAIYCYIMEQVQKWYSKHGEEYFEKLPKGKKKK